MFRGRFEHALDGKGRTSLPARLRAELVAAGAPTLIVTTGLDPCLVAYPLSEWSAFERRLAELPAFDPSVVALRRCYVSGAIECDVDASGRILIPSPLREYAGLNRHVLWAGMGRYVELWDNARFSQLRSQMVRDDLHRAEIGRRLSELGL